MKSEPSKFEVRQEPETHDKSVVSKSSKDNNSGDKDDRKEDTDRGEGHEERESNDRSEVQKRSTKTKNNKSSSSSHGRRYPPDRYPYPAARGPYSGPGMHGPRGPPPPPHYGYPGAGGPPDHYRVPPPPPHYHQMPPLHHQGHPGAPYAGPNGHYGPPPPNMGGRPGPNYHPYGPYMGGHPMPPYHQMPSSYPSQANPPAMSQGTVVGSDSNSISSSKSKGSGDRKSSKSSSSKAMRKKRTIDGVHDTGSQDMQHLPSAYSFRRTNSNSSSSSTVTAGNNTSTETHITEDSPHKRERGNDLPPLSHPNNNSTHDEHNTNNRSHRRNYSGTSTTSSLSVGGFSLSSYEGPRGGGGGGAPLIKSSPKRRKGSDSTPLVVDTNVDCGGSTSMGQHAPRLPSSASLDAQESTRFEQLSMEDHESKPRSNSGDENGSNLFLSLSTSPINHGADVDATPISKNTKKSSKDAADKGAQYSASRSKASGSTKKMIDRPTDTPTPPIPGGMGESEMMTDEHMLNRHLRGQSFTPLPHMGNGGESTSNSPSNMGFSSIAPQLSWSIAGDTPSLGDLAEWEEDRQQSSKSEHKRRPSSTTSDQSRNMVISPHSFAIWTEDQESSRKEKSGGEARDGDSIRLSILTPHSDMGMQDEGGLSGTTTPLPIFFDQQPSSEERENHSSRSDSQRPSSRKGSQQHQHGDPDHIHQLFVTNGGRGHGEKKPNNAKSMHHFWSKHDQSQPTPVGSGMEKSEGYGPPMGLPPTPLFAGSDYRDDGFVRSPLQGDRRDGPSDFFPSGAMYGHPGNAGSQHDRVRNLRGRVMPGAHHAPMPIHIPPPMSSHLPLTSPMGVGPAGKAGLWSPHHGGMPPPLASPLHMSPMNMSQSKRKCVPLKPPIPSKFQGDIEKMKTAQVPEFTSLVNFPAHMSQKQAVNLPDGMRCCVMCGSACPCSSGNKSKKNNGAKNSGNAKSSDCSLAPRSSNGQDLMGEKSGYAIIPTQNKGLCTLCDVNVWVVVTTGLEIKWCKGCKNFRPWAAFGDKGLATKCLRCRERQREKYALQKEEKEKARMVAKAGKK